MLYSFVKTSEVSYVYYDECGNTGNESEVGNTGNESEYGVDEYVQRLVERGEMRDARVRRF